MSDKDLDDLLDSALDDFDKKLTVQSSNEQPCPSATSSALTESKVTIEKTELYVDDVDYDDRPSTSMSKLTSTNLNKSAQKGSSKSTAPGFNLTDDDMKLFDEIFNDVKTKETMKQFTEALNTFKEGDEQKLFENFGKVMSELSNDNLDLDDDELDAKITKNLENLNLFKDLGKTGSTLNTDQLTSETNESNSEEKSKTSPINPLQKILEEMNKNSEKVLNNPADSFPFSPDFFSKFASSLDPDNQAGAAGGPENQEESLDGASSLMMEPILSMLFSKDILYPSLNLMLENYDKYIDERREKMNDEELNKCNFQKECIKEMCKVYEDSKETDSKEAKAEQLKKILDLLEKCGVCILFLLLFFNNLINFNNF